MGTSDIGELSSSQRLRDEQLVESIRKKVVAPLRAELNELIPGYADLNDAEKFLALLRLNEMQAPHGDFLLVDFGELGIGPLSDTRCAFFSGIDSRACERVRCVDATMYRPTFSQGDTAGISKDGMPNNLLKVVCDKDGRSERYDQLPTSFKVAVAAEVIRQNVFCTRAEACRYAAGLSSSITFCSADVRANADSRGQIFGWSVFIRDTAPKNELMLSIATWIRGVARAIDKFEPSVPDYNGGSVRAVAADNRRRNRSRSDRTDTLVCFIDEHLPSHGYHVGQRGEGYLSWKKARQMFNETYPEYAYSERGQAFENAYHNAKKARGEGR